MQWSEALVAGQLPACRGMWVYRSESRIYLVISHSNNWRCIADHRIFYITSFLLEAFTHVETVKPGTNSMLCDPRSGSSPKRSISPGLVANKFCDTKLLSLQSALLIPFNNVALQDEEDDQQSPQDGCHIPVHQQVLPIAMLAALEQVWGFGWLVWLCW